MYTHVGILEVARFAGHIYLVCTCRLCPSGNVSGRLLTDCLSKDYLDTAIALQRPWSGSLHDILCVRTEHGYRNMVLLRQQLQQ